MKIVILAGGAGTRLWPVSRSSKPKQVQPFIGSQTLLQKTFSRVRRGFALDDIFVSTSRAQAPLIRRQLPKLPWRNYILETAKRDTAGAIGLAAVAIAKRFPGEVMMTVGSDHYIKDELTFIRLAKLADRIITERPAQSVLIAVRPTYAETGYGYLKVNKLYRQYGDDEVFYGQRFVEKPDLATARSYVKRWDYLWNTNMFCWQVDYLLGLYRRYLPTHYRILKRIQPALGTARELSVVTREFAKLPRISVDYGIMEKTKKIVVIPASFGWADVGHWRTVRDVLAKRKSDNVTRGKHLGVDSSGNLIYSYTGRLIGTVGVRNMVIIDTEDALLVCPKNRAQDVKKIVELLEEQKLRRYL